MLALLTPVGVFIGLRGQLIDLAMAQLLLVAPVMVSMGAQGVLGVTLVPQRQRCAIFSIAYSLAMALFAGTAPLVATWLAARQWNSLTMVYPLIYAAAALITVQRLRHASVR
ncbi:MAG: hypothetical protein FJ077_15015 [Cyanobacteria bacterium K_DeepCast_35m_m2_023]|nr:hypothetical protein [Cyanobacteria bacterium K_DeepCast_35m_m2_023]